MFRILMMRIGIASCLGGFLLFAALLPVTGCRRTQPPPEEPEPYRLPEAHPDDSNPMKIRFFQEPFRNLAGEMVQIRNFIGTPLVIVVFPSFKTEDGRRSLIGMEALLRGRESRFRAVFIPIEDADTIRPSIVRDPQGMMFLFRADDTGNLSLADKYSDLFWNPELIATDYPMDPQGRHYVGPFYWVVDETGTIREKLIDYSNERGVGIDEIAEVLDALPGPAIPLQPEPEPAASTAKTEDEIPAPSGGETGP